jgi:hypothetical protein
LFYYFKVFQSFFPDDWPVPKSFKNVLELEKHAEYVLKERKSQLVKTNGFGAILRLFPPVYLASEGNYKGYSAIISKLSGKMIWTPQPGQVQGTGRAFQNYLVAEMEKILF